MIITNMSSVNFQTIDKFTAFTEAFERQKYNLFKKYGLGFEEMYDILFDDYLENLMDKYNPHQAYCFCKKRFNWVILDYLNKKPLLYDFKNYNCVSNNIEYGQLKKVRKQPSYHTSRFGKPRGYNAGRPKKAIKMFFKGKFIRTFESIAEATKYMKVSKGMIASAIKRKIKCHNYNFYYLEDKI